MSLLLDKPPRRDFNLWAAPATLGALAIAVPTLITVLAVDFFAGALLKVGGTVRKHATGPLLDFLLGRPMR